MLQGKEILITREAKQARIFSQKVLQHGGTPVEVPLLKIVCTERDEDKLVLQTLSKYQWIFFTSANGVACFMQLAKKQQIPLNLLAEKKYAVVGNKTEKVLNTYKLQADFMPAVYNADNMAETFLAQFPDPGPLLLVRGNRSREVLPNRFADNEVNFDTIEVYASQYNEQAFANLQVVFMKHRFDFLTFTSPSTIDAFIKAKGMDLLKDESICVCIGSTTERRAKEAGFKYILTPAHFTIEGMLKSMQDYVTRKG